MWRPGMVWPSGVRGPESDHIICPSPSHLTQHFYPSVRVTTTLEQAPDSQGPGREEGGWSQHLQWLLQPEGGALSPLHALLSGQNPGSDRSFHPLETLGPGRGGQAKSRNDPVHSVLSVRRDCPGTLEPPFPQDAHPPGSSESGRAHDDTECRHTAGTAVVTRKHQGWKSPRNTLWFGARLQSCPRSPMCSDIPNKWASGCPDGKGKQAGMGRNSSFSHSFQIRQGLAGHVAPR